MNIKGKVVTIISSGTVSEDITKKIIKDLSLQGCIVLSNYIFSTDELSDADIYMLSYIRRKKIEMSDIVFVINICAYDPENINDIKYAKSLNKRIIYFADLYRKVVIHKIDGIDPRTNSTEVKLPQYYRVKNPRVVVKVTKRSL